MKHFSLLVTLVGAVTTDVSPIEKTIQLLSDLQAKVVKDGEAAEKVYTEFTDFCDDESKESQYAVKDGKGAAERLQASIEQSSATISDLETKLGELASSIATNEKDLASAIEIRDHEHADFKKLDTDLAETVDMLERAAGIIEREMKGSSFVQSDAMAQITQALQSLVNAPAVNSLDKTRVQALLEEQDQQPGGAPDAAAYESQSGGILSTLEDMLEKAKAQRSEAQKAEMNAKFNFDMLKQKLQDQITQENGELDDAKKGKAAAEEAKAVAEGDLSSTQKNLAEDKTKLKDLQHECMTKASEYEEEQHERSNELEALATAKKILEEKTGGAADRAYAFVQTNTARRAQIKTVDANTQQVLALVQRLANAEGSRQLSQLAIRIRSAVAMGDDPFGKVKGMIQQMIETLVAEAAKEAGHKAYCDKEMSETKAKKLDKEDEVDSLNTKIDRGVAKISKLVEDIAALESELASIAKAQQEADAMRADEKGAWAAAKSDYESGLEGVQMALQVLRDYYASDKGESLLQATGDISARMSFAQKHEKATGAASGIIGMLEVVESDFSRLLAEGQVAEDTAEKAYDEFSQDNKVTKAMKSTEVEYKTKDKKETEADLAANRDDLGVSQAELDAILDYYTKIKGQCIAKPEPYEERKRRREAEIAGLKQALEILENESAPSFLAIRRSA